MKTEFVDLTETRKSLVVEIPAEVVDAEVERLAREYSRTAKVPGFRPGKVPPRVVRQRYKDQILHDVAHDLVPRAIDEALRERGVEPVDTPEVGDLVVEEGRPLRFTASFETVPPVDPGSYDELQLRRPNVEIDDDAVARALDRLRQRASRYENVEGRAVEAGDTVVVDLTRQLAAPGTSGGPERHEHVSVEIGAAVNPPGFDDALMGTRPGDEKHFTAHYPADFAVKELAGSEVRYEVTIRSIRKRVVPDLDDEFAKDVGDFDTLDALRARLREDITREAEREADRQLRSDLLRALASRVTFDAPAALVDREVARRIDDFAHGLAEQGVDPARAGIDWAEFRQSQHEAATGAVKAALVLDEVARREGLTVAADEVDREVAGYAARSGRSAAAVRAGLEKEGGLARLEAGMRRDKAVDFLLSRARIARV